ncbi:MAG: protein O-mannosyl-transferase family [Phycisphaerales bacterium JB063]
MPSQPESESPRLGRSVLGWWAVAVAAFLLYALTASRTIQWQDYGQFVLRIVTGELFNELGLALAHPIHFWLGQAAAAVLPAQPPLAVSLVSALAGAITIANVFGITRRVTGRCAPALAAAGSLLVANTFWRMSTMPECYTVTTALLSAELWCMTAYFTRRATLPRDAGSNGSGVLPALAGMMLFNGLGLANHNMALLTLPVSGIVLLLAWKRSEIKLRGFAMAMSAWFVGASPYLALVVIEATRSGDLGAAVTSALFGIRYADEVLNARPGIKQAGISVAFTLLSFPGITLPLAAAGLFAGRAYLGQHLRSAGLWWAWGAALAIHLLFVLRYNVVDQHTFLLPAYTIISLFVGVGFGWLSLRLKSRGRVLLSAAVALSLVAAPGVYVLTAKVARDRNALGAMARNKPYRDDYRYLFVPWGMGETSAARMSQEAVSLAGDRGVIVIEDPMAGFAVAYRLREGSLAGVLMHEVVPDGEPAWDAWGGRAVVLVPASRGRRRVDPPTGYTWRASGELYVLVADSGGGVDAEASAADNPATP